MAETKPKKLSTILYQLSFFYKKRIEFFLELPIERRVSIIFLVSPRVRRDIMKRLPDEERMNLLEHLDPDRATDLVRLLPKRQQEKVLENLSEEVKNEVALLSQFDPKTAAGIMSLNYVQVGVDEKVADVAQRVRTHEQRTGRLPIIVAMKEGKVQGFLPGHELGLAKPSERIEPYLKKLTTIAHSATEREVLRLFRTRRHGKVAVLGESGNVLGIIYSDDVLRVLQEHESASLYDFAGVNEEEGVSDPIRRKVQYRYKWLILNLATAFLASGVVNLFHGTIERNVLLAVYMPIVAGMGGNAGTQTLAVLVRGIALQEIDLSTAGRALVREVGAGAANGLINAILVALIVVVFNRDVKVALVLAFAMVFNLVVAGFFGTLVPLIMKRIGKDPATSATIFITTATDVLGFMAFLGLATLVLR